MRKQFITLVVLLLIGCTLPQNYNVELATELWEVCGLTYCNVESLINWDCGILCNDLKGKVEFVYYYLNSTADNGLSYLMYVDNINKIFITAFRGTTNPEQLVQEILQSGDVPYTLYNISQATVLNFFMDAYLAIRPDVLLHIQEAYKNYSDYTFAFTGHSLGGALTTHAALDIILGGYVPKDQVILYNYGSPRVGNYKFALYVNETIPIINRLVHHKDIVPHVPPCQLNILGQCTTYASQNEDLEDFKGVYWPAWHIWTNIFYPDENSTTYIVCKGGEDPKCADQYPIATCNTKDHGDYLGIQMECGGNAIFTEDQIYAVREVILEYMIKNDIEKIDL